MAFFEAVQAFAGLDAGFFIGIAMENLLWVFAFLAINDILFKGRGLLRNFVVFSVFIWAFREFASIWGLGGFAINAFFFFAFIAFMHFFVLEPRVFGKHTAVADVASFYGIIFFLNFFAG